MSYQLGAFVRSTPRLVLIIPLFYRHESLLHYGSCFYPPSQVLVAHHCCESTLMVFGLQSGPSHSSIHSSMTPQSDGPAQPTVISIYTYLYLLPGSEAGERMSRRAQDRISVSGIWSISGHRAASGFGKQGTLSIDAGVVPSYQQRLLGRFPSSRAKRHKVARNVHSTALVRRHDPQSPCTPRISSRLAPCSCGNTPVAQSCSPDQRPWVLGFTYPASFRVSRQSTFTPPSPFNLQVAVEPLPLTDVRGLLATELFHDLVSTVSGRLRDI